MADVPRLYRVILQVSDLDKAGELYTKLPCTQGRRIRGSRHYFDCGPVILALVDPTVDGEKARANADYICFSVKNLERIHERAAELGCLSKEDVHGKPAGQIVRRPWGKRSFYARDPFKNRICFVDAKTVFTGK